MTSSSRILIGATVALVIGSVVTATNAVADGSGAFIGGMVTARVMGNMRDRTEAEQQQAYYAQQSAQQQQYQQQAPVQQAAPAKTPQQKLDELDSLAAGGYITPDEYKQKKQAILNSM